MKTTSIKTGKTYEVKAGRHTTVVKVKAFNKQTGGWVCETQGGKSISVKDAARFVREIMPKKSTSTTKPVKGKTVTKTDCAKGGKSNGQMSGLDAAFQVLVETGRAMKVGEIADIALTKGYCKLNGATPELTISAAIQREIKAKNGSSRFVKAGTGLYAAR